MEVIKAKQIIFVNYRQELNLDLLYTCKLKVTLGGLNIIYPQKNIFLKIAKKPYFTFFCLVESNYIFH